MSSRIRRLSSHRAIILYNKKFSDSYSKLRHKSFGNENFHHHISTNIFPIVLPSVSFAPPAVAHTKLSNCWIDSENFSGLTFKRSYHKQCNFPFNCITASSKRVSQFLNRSLFIDSIKMVFPTDIENHEVNFSISILSLSTFHGHGKV